MLQKQHHHQQIDIQPSQQRPLVGGHLKPTTFRPPNANSFFNRRSDTNANQVNPPAILSHSNFIQRSASPSNFGQKQQELIQYQNLVNLQQLTQPQQLIQPQHLSQPQRFIQPQQQIQAQPLIQRQQLLPAQQLIQPQFVQSQQITQPRQYFLQSQLQQIQSQQLLHQPFNQITDFKSNFADQSRQSVINQSSQQPQQLNSAQQPVNQFQRQPQQIIFNQQLNQNSQQSNYPQQSQQHLLHNQYLQANNLQELQQRLSRQYNRFNFGNNQHAYVPLG